MTVSPLPDTGPIALLFPSINISQGTTATVIPLVNEFREPGVSPSAFQYQVVADSNPSLFAAAPLLVSSQQLLLRVTPDALGSTELTVRATDPNGHSADATIVVNVSGSSTGQASGTANGRSSRSVGVAQDENGGSTEIATLLGPSSTITTVVGNGSSGYSGDGAAAVNAQLTWPDGVAVDAAGDIYIADTYNDVVRKVDTTGVISTVAGNGTWGYSGDGQAATNAELACPTGVAVDAAGDIYIADCYNNVIRKVDHITGYISTVAGNGSWGYSGDGEAATSAELSDPAGVAVDAAGDIYIADSGNDVIRKVDTSGYISTVAGNGNYGYSGDDEAATSAELSYPEGVAVDAAGDIYIADSGNDVVRKVDTSGVISTVAGNGSWGYGGDGEAATGAELSYPTGVAVDAAGDLFIADSDNNAVREVDTSGVISTIAGTGTEGYSGDGGPAGRRTTVIPRRCCLGLRWQSLHCR